MVRVHSKYLRKLNIEIDRIERDLDILAPSNAIESQMIEYRLQRLEAIIRDLNSLLQTDVSPTYLRLVVRN